MKEKELLGHDQFGNLWGPLNPKSPKRSLLETTFRKTAVPMFVDTKEGKVFQVGYVVKPTRGSNDSELWVTLFWRKEEAWRIPA